MALKKKRPEREPESRPRSGRLRLVERMPEPGEAGSIEQHLDMLESGPLRGDEILHEHGRVRVRDKSQSHDELPPEDEMQRNYNITMAEPNREGDEMSGDEHSMGLQGDEPELIGQDTIESGWPGEETENQLRRARREENAD